jgi:hypothetical protein
MKNTGRKKMIKHFSLAGFLIIGLVAQGWAYDQVPVINGGSITGRVMVTGNIPHTDVVDDYPRIEKDNLDLLRYLPLALSVISFPYTKGNSERSATDIPAEVALFHAGRITGEIGAFKIDDDDHDQHIDLLLHVYL